MHPVRSVDFTLYTSYLLYLLCNLNYLLSYCSGTYSVRKVSNHVSHCQLEVDLVFNSLLSHAPEGEWMKIAPFRILSFDIECQGRKGIHTPIHPFHITLHC